MGKTRTWEKDPSIQKVFDGCNPSSPKVSLAFSPREPRSAPLFLENDAEQNLVSFPEGPPQSLRKKPRRDKGLSFPPLLGRNILAFRPAARLERRAPLVALVSEGTRQRSQWHSQRRLTDITPSFLLYETSLYCSTSFRNPYPCTSR